MCIVIYKGNFFDKERQIVGDEQCFPLDEYNLEKLIEWDKKMREDGWVDFTFSTEDESSSMEVNCYKYRPETDEEYEHRMHHINMEYEPINFKVVMDLMKSTLKQLS